MAINHTHDGETIFAVINALIECADPKGIVEHSLRTVERDPVLCVVISRLSVILFELHDTTA